MPDRRLPAEWEPQDGVLLAWPHSGTDWQPVLDQVEPVFAELAAHISHQETALVLTDSPQRVFSRLRAAGATLERVRLIDLPTDDTWARDFGPLTVLQGQRPRLLDFVFNGWGGKFEAGQDNRVTGALLRTGALGDTRVEPVDLVLEGGSVESDGAGTLLTTSRCLLHPRRNPHCTQAQLEHRLCTVFGLERVLWLDSGYLDGDDTDGHIDTLARFAPDDTIVYVACDDPRDPHYPELLRMAAELRQLRTLQHRAYRLLPLPWPQAIRDADGTRLPASYANFLVINGAVLVPAYGDPNDYLAREVVATAFPDRRTVSMNCRPLLLQRGSLHCLTMQLPRGVLS